jgi:hypothetical protein
VNLHQGVAIPDLIIGSIAEAHDVVLVHHDRDFDDIATVATGLRTRWIVAPRSRCRLASGCPPSITPLLGRVTLPATWANTAEHAVGPPDYWGSRGRGFKSRRPDNINRRQVGTKPLLRAPLPLMSGHVA